MMNKTDKQTKRLLRIWLALVLMIISIPVFSIEAFADIKSGDTPETRSVQYYDPIDNLWPTQNCQEIEQNMGETFPGWYVLSKDTTFEEPVKIIGNVNLILCNGATLTAKQGICVERNCSLTICSECVGCRQQHHD